MLPFATDTFWVWATALTLTTALTPPPFFPVTPPAAAPPLPVSAPTPLPLLLVVLALVGPVALALTIVTDVLVLRPPPLLPVVRNVFPPTVARVLNHQWRSLEITSVHFTHCTRSVLVRRKCYEREIAFHVYVPDSPVIAEHVFQVPRSGSRVETSHENLVGFFVRAGTPARSRRGFSPGFWSWTWHKIYYF